MAFVEEKFVPSGIYHITNAGSNQSIICSDGAERLNASSNGDHEWSIVLLAGKKWNIRSHTSGYRPNIEPEPDEGDEIPLRPAQHKPHSWVLKRRATAPDTYLIYSPSQPGLFWSLSDVEEGASLTLGCDDKNPLSWWKFRKVECPRKPDEMVYLNEDTEPNLLAVDRPTQSPVVNNKVTVIIPPGWLTTISAISVMDGMNLIRVNHIINGVLSTQQFISRWDSEDQAMTVNESGMSSCAIAATDQPSVLIFEFFHSKNKLKRDPLMLSEHGLLSTNLRVACMERQDTMKTVPDYQTFWIFDETPTPRGTNAILNVHSSKNSSGIDLNDPGNPAPGTTNPGFNDTLDLPRPNSMAEYMTNYHIIFVIDDSSSMRGQRWTEVRLALTELSKEAMQYDADGMEICFLNSQKRKDCIANPADMLDIFDAVQPRGWTYTGAKLKILLNRCIKRFDDAAGKPEYADIKPVDIIVLTDGAPTDDPAVVIADAIRRLDGAKHHLNAIGIQFVQIGDEDGAAAALQLLKDCPLRRMVDTVPYTKALTRQRLAEVLLGTLHPSIKSAIAEKSSTAVKECPICCSDDIPEYEYPRFPPTNRCQHEPIACRQCLAQHIEAQLFSQAMVLEINCPSHPCPEKLGYDEIKQWAAADCFKRYNSIALRQHLSEDINFRWCLNAKCDHGQTHRLGDEYPIVQCTWCYKKSCFTHQLPWHEGLTCAQFDSLRPDVAADQEAAQLLIGTTTQQCSKCKKRIERSAGCDHMTCRCGHQFCWRCGATISHDETYGSSNHLPTCPLKR